jgi:hypothetical protein
MQLRGMAVVMRMGMRIAHQSRLQCAGVACTSHLELQVQMESRASMGCTVFVGERGGGRRMYMVDSNLANTASDAVCLVQTTRVYACHR